VGSEVKVICIQVYDCYNGESINVGDVATAAVFPTESRTISPRYGRKDFSQEGALSKL